MRYGGLEMGFIAWPLAAIAVASTVTVSLKLLLPRKNSIISLVGLLGFLGYLIRQPVLGEVQVARLALQWPRETGGWYGE
jgi:hypothetical protein